MMVKHRYFKALAKQKIIKEVHSWSEEKKREFYRNMKIVEGGVKNMSKFQYTADICDMLEELNEENLKDLWLIVTKMVQKQRQENEKE